MKNSFEWVAKNIDFSKYIDKNTLLDKLNQKEDSIAIREITGSFIILVFNQKNSSFYMKNIFISNKEKTCLGYIFEKCDYDEYLRAERFVYERI
ncbi:MAG: hypothetical protein K9H48_07690 [Melioribacteraceae bacterium]|nr:hypothetical protein [Melioribacteraceae bacterium]